MPNIFERNALYTLSLNNLRGTFGDRSDLSREVVWNTSCFLPFLFEFKNEKFWFGINNFKFTKGAVKIAKYDF